MRIKLKKLSGKARARFKCVFQERVTKGNGQLKLVLLRDVRRRGERITDHMWVEDGFWSRDWEPGDRVKIEARVEEYVRRDGSRDYRLRDVHPVWNYRKAAEATAAVTAKEAAEKSGAGAGVVPAS